jgi:AbrB family looped-hinge helix DNA binding protein
MRIAQSRLTAQGQISVPAEVRRRLGLQPGSVIEWEEEEDRVVVRRAGRYTSKEIHRILFPMGPPRTRTLEELKDGLRTHARAVRANGLRAGR